MNAPAATQTVQIVNKLGLHARASAKFVTLASNFDAQVTVTHDGQSVNGASILDLLMLVAAPGESIVISAEGAQAIEAVDALAELVRGKFGEEGMADNQ